MDKRRYSLGHKVHGDRINIKAYLQLVLLLIEQCLWKKTRKVRLYWMIFFVTGLTLIRSKVQMFIEITP